MGNALALDLLNFWRAYLQLDLGSKSRIIFWLNRLEPAFALQRSAEKAFHNENLTSFNCMRPHLPDGVQLINHGLAGLGAAVRRRIRK